MGFNLGFKGLRTVTPWWWLRTVAKTCSSNL